MKFKGIYIKNDTDSWVLVKGTDKLTEEQSNGSCAIKLNKVYMISSNGTTTSIIDRTNGIVKVLDHECYGQTAQIMNVNDTLYLVGGNGNNTMYQFNEEKEKYEHFMDCCIQTDDTRIVMTDYNLLFVGHLENTNGEWIRKRTITELNIKTKTIKVLDARSLNDIAPYMKDENILIGFGSFPSGFPSDGGTRDEIKWNDIYIMSLLDGRTEKTGFKVPTKSEYICFVDKKEDKKKDEYAVFGYCREFDIKYNLNVPFAIKSMVRLYYVLPKTRIHLIDTDTSAHYYLSSQEVEKLMERIIAIKKDNVF